MIASGVTVARYNCRVVDVGHRFGVHLVGRDGDANRCRAAFLEQAAAGAGDLNVHVGLERRILDGLNNDVIART